MSEAMRSRAISVPASGGLHLKAVRETTREADFVASTDSIDRYGDVVEQSSWQLERYRANPVVLFAHDCDELPIGQATHVQVINGQLECTIKFATEKANPMAENVWQSVLERTLRAVSVGFMPKTIRYEKHNGEDVCVLADCELFEISVAPIPVNPDALQKAKAKAFSDHTNKAADDVAENKDNMTPEQIKALEGELAVQKSLASGHEKTIGTLKAEHEALTTQNKSLASERDAFAARATAAESKVIEGEVEALVGKKITPAEKATFVKLRSASPELFAEMIAQRGDLGLLDTKAIVPTDDAGVKRATDEVESGGPDLTA